MSADSAGPGPGAAAVPGTGGCRGAVVGIDIGGTKILAGLVGEDGRIVRTATVQTPAGGDAAAVEDALDSALRAVRGADAVRAVGVSAAGFMNRDGSRVMFAPHLPWRDEPVRDRLSQRWGVPVALENDASCAGVAEAVSGAGADTDSMILVTVGTGIGGAVVLSGELVRGANGMAGEFGHQRVVADGRPCPCGLNGCWEQYASGRALLRAAAERGWSGESGAELTEAAQAGDTVALAAFSEVGTWLGVGLAGLASVLDPELIVVGGGVSDAGDLLLEPARAAFAAHVVGRSHRVLPEIVVASHGPAAGMLGAATLAARLSSAPRLPL